MRFLTRHRQAREASILHRLAKGEADIPTMVRAIYIGLDPRLTGAAGYSVLAHLEDLVARGIVATDGDPVIGGSYGWRVGVIPGWCVAPDTAQLRIGEFEFQCAIAHLVRAKTRPGMTPFALTSSPSSPEPWPALAASSAPPIWHCRPRR